MYPSIILKNLSGEPHFIWIIVKFFVSRCALHWWFHPEFFLEPGQSDEYFGVEANVGKLFPFIQLKLQLTDSNQTGHVQFPGNLQIKEIRSSLIIGPQTTHLIFPLSPLPPWWAHDGDGSGHHKLAHQQLLAGTEEVCLDFPGTGGCRHLDPHCQLLLLTDRDLNGRNFGLQLGFVPVGRVKKMMEFSSKTF